MSLDTKAVVSAITTDRKVAAADGGSEVSLKSTPRQWVYSCPPGCVMFKVGQELATIEREMILRTVDMTRGNRTRAAKFLGISARTLYSKLLKIDRENQARAATPTKMLPKV